MLQVVDRKPLGNKKNNKLALSIPGTITTLADLISLLNNGVYGDVLANNEMAGPNVGVSEVGTPITRSLFESIEEGGDGLGELQDLAFCSATAAVSAGWTWIDFPRIFMLPPNVVAVAAEQDSLFVSIKGVTEKGFFAAITQQTFSAGAVTPTMTNGKYMADNTNYLTDYRYYTQVNVVSSLTYTAPSLTTPFKTGTIQYVACLDTGINTEVK